MPNHPLQAARIVAGTLTLLSREIHEVGPPVNLWSPELSQDFIRNTAVQVGRGEAVPLWVDERHPARGLAVYVPSPWESNFFGFDCARILGPFLVVEDQSDREGRVRVLARRAVDMAAAKGHRMITAKVFHDPAVMRGFLGENFTLAEVGASLSSTIGDEDFDINLPSGFLLLEGADVVELADEAIKSLGDFFYDGHFRHDPMPGVAEAKRLWSMVARMDLSGKADPALLLWDRKKDQAAGIATVHIQNGIAFLNILALSQAYRGRGLGRPLLLAAINGIRGRASRIKVETASYNLSALKLYQSVGLTHDAPLAAFHCHLGL